MALADVTDRVAPSGGGAADTRRLPKAVKRRFFELREEDIGGRPGMSLRACADKLQIALSTAARWEKERKQMFEDAVKAGEIDLHDPKPYEDLSPEAKKAIDDFLVCCRRYFKLDEQPMRTPYFWGEVAQVISAAGTPGEVEQLLFVVHPGVGKTSLVLAYITWRVLRERAFGNESFAVTYGMKAQHLSRRGLQQIKEWLEDSELVEAFGRCHPTTDDANQVWTQDKIAVAGMGRGKEATVAAVSRTGSIRGIRPHLSVWDDIIDEDDRDPQKTAETASWFDNNAARRPEPGGVLVIVGNHVSPHDFYHLLDKRKYVLDRPEGTVEEKSWRSFKYPAHDLERCPGDGTHPAYPKGCLLWPERWSYVMLQKIRQDDEVAFEVQYQLSDQATDDVLVPRIWIEGGSQSADGGGTVEFRGCLDTERAFWEMPAEYDPAQGVLVASLDPSPTRWAVAELWLYQAPFSWLIAFERGRMKSPDYPILMADWTQKARALVPGFDTWVVEKTGAHYLHEATDFQVVLGSMGLILVAHDTHATNKNSQEFGVWSIRSEFRYGHVRLPWAPGETRELMRTFFDEHTRYPYYPTDDSVMATWFFRLHRGEVPAPNFQAPTVSTPSWMTGRRSA